MRFIIVLVALLSASIANAQGQALRIIKLQDPQVAGGLVQRDRATLPITIDASEGTLVEPKWNGVIVHVHGEWRAGQEVHLRLTDCDRSTMNIAWHAINRDGDGPLRRGSDGTCSARFELRAAGNHEFSINYYWHEPVGKRGTAQDSAPFDWRVEGRDWWSSLKVVLLPAAFVAGALAFKD